MIEKYALCEIEELKIKVHENINVNDDVVCGICDELISIAKENKDWQSVAFGHVWRADYYFYVESNMRCVSKELECAQEYINEKNPSELLEKFYALYNVLFSNSYDKQSAFRYTLKALNVSERLDIRHRIGINYGNISAYYLDYELYDEALFYLHKSMEVLRSLPDTKPRFLRMLLINFINIYLKLGKLELMKSTIEELSSLPFEEKDLKIYVDYAYLLYYAEIQNQEKSLYYLQEMQNDGLMTFPNRVYLIEFLMNALEAMISIKNKVKSSELLQSLQKLIKEDELEPLLKLCKLNIKYSQKFETKKELYHHYHEYYYLYLKAQSQVNLLKIEGLRAKIELNDNYTKYTQSKKVLEELYDLVNYDELTNVYNRYYFNIKQDEILNSNKYTNIGLAIFDIDYFKEYNDYYGHLEGDEILKQVASILKENANEQMGVFRYGGDEFVCLSWDLNFEQIAEYVNQVKEAIKEKSLEHIHSRCAKIITLSIGYGNKIVSTKVDILNLFDEVDKALYVVKNSGRNNAKSIIAMEGVHNE
ncbi:GGDEF domain-containing protein [Clostridioides difficile]